ncbi:MULTISPECIES: phage tail protein [Thalassospira]|uniref:Tail fiber protein n=1 Tax=Thalassospira aquimaris TaxID=3037796 RepID=A0ABT6GFX6_9PROT|nr:MULTISPECIES: tail fiber protein [Thalassospira]MDG4720921.1 tail fiber protein [Thalassospira sp. FZY0004]
MKTKMAACLAAGLAILTTMTIQSDEAKACNDNGYIGSICWTANKFCPEGYVRADGTSYPYQQFQALLALYGNTYGGSPSQNTFAVPNLMGREPVGTGTGPGLTPRAAGYPVNGDESSLVATPSHNHGVALSVDSGISVAVQDQPGTERTPGGNVPAAPQAATAQMYANSTNAVMADGSVSANIAGQNVYSGATPASGQAQPIPVLGPQLVMLACVNYSGTFPVNPN